MKLTASFLATVAALGLVTAHEASGRVAAESPKRQFVPPRGEFVIARTAIRLLSDGKQIAVTRSYRVKFVTVEGGFQLDGTLIGVEVDMPPALGKLADLERKRQDTGLFPIMLRSDGTIRDQETNNIDRDARQQAVTKVGEFFSQAEPDPLRRDEGLKLLSQLASNTPNIPWPADLFYASPGERRLARQVTLADGSEGTVEVVMRVAAPLPCGIPQSVERIVTTELAGTRRVSREVYTFTIPG